MTDQDIIANSRQLVLAIETIASRHGLDEADTVSLTCMAVSEILARHLGIVGTVEHLRDMADTLERQVLPH
jgi:hypothetical protein